MILQTGEKTYKSVIMLNGIFKPGGSSDAHGSTNDDSSPNND